MKQHIEALIKCSVDDIVCNVCYEHPIKLLKCSSCNFFVCGKCDIHLKKCPQCRKSTEDMLDFTVLSNMKKYDVVNDGSKINNDNSCYEEVNEDSDINHGDRYCFDGEDSDDDPIESLQNKLAMEIFGF